MTISFRFQFFCHVWCIIFQTLTFPFFIPTLFSMHLFCIHRLIISLLAEIKKHVEKICEPCTVKDIHQDKLELKQMSASGETTLCKDKGGQCAAKKGAIRETMSITAPAEDGAKLLLSNWHNPTAADLGSYCSSLSIL